MRIFVSSMAREVVEFMAPVDAVAAAFLKSALENGVDRKITYKVLKEADGDVVVVRVSAKNAVDVATGNWDLISVDKRKKKK